MATLYSELRSEMRRKGVKSHDIAVWLNLSDVCISKRMTGKTPWSQSEMYTIMQKMYLPLHKLHVVFPPDGMYAGPLEDPPPSTEQQIATLLLKLVREASA